jgi:glycosyltransferase involved in cell wall biosynthesis
MNILYIASNYVPATGGTEISDATLLRELYKKGHKTTVITYADKDSIEKEGPIVFRISNKDPTQTINNILNQTKPDLIYTTLGWSRHAITSGKKFNIPTVLYVSSLEYGDNIALGKPFSPNYIVTPSQFAKRRIFEQSGRDAEVIPPCIDFSRFEKKINNPEYVTLINPVVVKGSEIFYSLVSKMSDVKFLTKAGWLNLQKEGDWNIDRLQLIAESLGDELVIPEKQHIPTYSNLTSIIDSKEMSWIYNNTKILLSPSLWEEAYGMSNVEAMYHGIPVIASNRAGIPESTDGAAILIDNPENVNEWQDALTKILTNKCLFEELKYKSLERAKRYSLDGVINQYEDFFKTVANK